MTILLTVLSLALSGMTGMPDQPHCTYRIVRTASSDKGVRAQETIRICDAGSNIVTLDNQVHILSRKRGNYRKILVTQFESSHGEAVPMEFRHGILYVHVYRLTTPNLLVGNVDGIKIRIKHDFVDHARYKFIDVYGNPVKK
jgi:hypothetical protein